MADLTGALAADSRPGLQAALDSLAGDAQQAATVVCLAAASPRHVRMCLTRTSSAPDLVVGVCTDVTAEHLELARARLRLSNAEAVVRSASAILIAVDGERRVHLWNSEATRVFGPGETEALGQPLERLVGAAAPGIEAGLASALREQQAVRISELRMTRPGADDCFLGLTINPVIADDGWRCVIFGRDITQQRIHDAQFAHALKLESIGQLAAGIAHEINTPAQFVGDNLRFLRDSFDELRPLLESLQSRPDAQGSGQAVDLPFLADEIPRALGESLAGLARISKIVGAMKEFSHPGTGEKVLVDLNRNIESTVTVARNEWKYVADLELALCPDLAHVPCLPDEMNQVVLNMVINAAHAIAERYGANSGHKGRIRISTGLAGEWVEIRIGDDGAGIPEKVRGRIFDPFFTTKGVGKGTGQGLSIARSVIVDKHGGTIDVASTPGVGTTFVIRIPLHPGPDPGARKP